MTSIPKDGKSYLVWTEHNGMFFVRWNMYAQGFVSSTDSGKAWWEEGAIVRWMDEKGQWHEVSDA
jgi:hypothetical protein